MYLLKMIGLFAISAWVVVGTYRRLEVGHFRASWPLWFFILTVLGLGLGICFVGLPSATEQVWGFPFTIAGGDFFGGRWHNGGVGRYLYFALLTNVSFAVGLCILPVALASLLSNRRS